MAKKEIMVGVKQPSGEMLHEAWQEGDYLVTPDGKGVPGSSWLSPGCHDDMLDKANTDTGPAPWLIMEGDGPKTQRLPTGLSLKCTGEKPLTDTLFNNIALPTNRLNYIKPSELMFFDVEVTVKPTQPLSAGVLDYGAIVGLNFEMYLLLQVNTFPPPTPHEHTTKFLNSRMGMIVKPNNGSPSLIVETLDFFYRYPNSAADPIVTGGLPPGGLHTLDVSSLNLSEIRVRIRHEIAWIPTPNPKYVHRYVFAYYNPITEDWVHAFTFFRMGGGGDEHPVTPEIPYYNMPEADAISQEPFSTPLYYLGIYAPTHVTPPSNPEVIFKDVKWVDAPTPDTEDLPPWQGYS